MIKKGEWTKSSFSNGNGGNNCVEVTITPVTRRIAVRNSKDRRDITYFTRDEWTAFLAGVKAGEFDV